MAFCVACGNKVQNDDVSCMHCGKRRLPEKNQTEELSTLTEFMGIKQEERINRFVEKRGSDFHSDNSNNAKSSCFHCFEWGKYLVNGKDYQTLLQEINREN